MDNLGEIIACLQKQKSIYEELLSISRKKKQVLIDGKVEQLDNMVKHEGNLIIEIGHLENRREKAVEALAKELGCSSQELTISYVCSKVIDKRVGQVKSLADSIGSILKELKEINDINGKLIEQSLDYINFSINLAADILEGQKAVYEANEEGNGKSSVRLFDAKV